MNKPIWIACCLFVLVACEPQTPSTSLDLQQTLSADRDSGFAFAEQAREFQFPQDHYAHPQFKNEWWYITGNLQNKQQRPFGFHITFFRSALAPQKPQSASAWATNQAWMAHIALSDIRNQHHYEAERLERGALGLAGIEQQPLRVFVNDWQLSSQNAADFPWQLHTASDDFTLDLRFSPLKPQVLQGDNGLSQKSATPGNASYYYAYTRLQTEGKIRLNGQDFHVTGLSWLDREWSTSALDEQQIGWDWFALQMDSGEELMLYQIREQNGKISRYSDGAWIDSKGHKTRLLFEDFQLSPQKYATVNGTKYPIHWQIKLPSKNQTFIVKAAFADQLMSTAFQYWEGAVTVFNQQGKKIGRGYLEMTGY